MTTTLKTQEKQPEMRPARWSPSNLWQEMENDLERLWANGAPWKNWE